MGLERKFPGFFRRTLTTGMLLGSLTFSYSCASKDSASVTGPNTEQPTQPKVNHAPNVPAGFSCPSEVEEGKTYVCTIPATDADGDLFGYKKIQGPEWLNFVSNTLTGKVPKISQDQSFTVEYELDDYKPNGVTRKSFPLQVRNIPDAYFITNPQMGIISSLSDKTIVFSQPVSYVPGDVIVTSVNQKTPFGMSKKILGMSADKKTASVRNASIQETFGSGELSFHSQVTFPSSYSGNIQRSPETSVINISKNFNEVLFDLDKNENTTYDQLTAKGSFSFNMNFDLDVGLNSRRVVFKAPTTEKIDITLTSNTSGFLQGLEKKIWDQYGTPMIYPTGAGLLPLVVVPHVSAYVGIRPGLVRDLEVRVIQEAVFNPGLTYENNSFSVSKDFSNDVSFTLRNPTKEFNVEGYVYLKPEFLIWGVAGAFIGASGGLIFDSKDGDYSLKFHELISAGLNGGVFGTFLPEYVTKVFEEEKLLSGRESGGNQNNSETRLAFVKVNGNSADIYSLDENGSSLANLTNSSPYPWNIYPSYSFDGNSIVFASKVPFSGQHSQLWLMNSDGSGKRQLFIGSSENAYPVLSPDGSKVAYVAGNVDNVLKIMNSDGSNSHTLFSDSGHNYRNLSWSKSGLLSFSSTRNSSQGEIYKINENGSGLVRLTSNSSIDDYPSWSPDGGQITFTSNRSGALDVWLMNSDGSNPRNITNSSNTADTNSCFASDGKTLFYISSPADTYSGSGQSEIWSVDLTTLSKKRITSNSYDESSLSCSH